MTHIGAKGSGATAEVVASSGAEPLSSESATPPSSESAAPGASSAPIAESFVRKDPGWISAVGRQEGPAIDGKRVLAAFHAYLSEGVGADARVHGAVERAMAALGVNPDAFLSDDTRTFAPILAAGVKLARVKLGLDQADERAHWDINTWMHAQAGARILPEPTRAELGFARTLDAELAKLTRPASFWGRLREDLASRF